MNDWKSESMFPSCRLLNLPSRGSEAYGSGSVGNAVEGQLSGGWADGGIGSVDLSGIHDSSVTPGGGGGCESSDGGDCCELHLDGCGLVLFTSRVIRRESEV